MLSPAHRTPNTRECPFFLLAYTQIHFLTVCIYLLQTKQQKYTAQISLTQQQPTCSKAVNFTEAVTPGTLQQKTQYFHMCVLYVYYSTIVVARFALSARAATPI